MIDRIVLGRAGSLFLVPSLDFCWRGGWFSISFYPYLATVTFKVEHVVSGVALNILAYGSSRFMSQAIFKMATTSPHVPGLPQITIQVWLVLKFWRR